MDTQLFGISFWQTFIGDTGAGIFAAAVIAMIARAGFSRWRRPKLTMRFAQTDSHEHKLTVLKGGRTRTIFTLIFRNDHRFVSLKSTIYWHLILPNFVDVSVKPIGDAHVHASVDESEATNGVKHITGHIDKPLYISSALQVPFRFILHGKDKKEYDIGYWFSTEYGKIPAIAERLEADFENVYKKIPKLKLRLAQSATA